MKVKCPKCSSLQETDPSSADSVFTCPDCGQKMKIRASGSKQESDAPGSVSEEPVGEELTQPDSAPVKKESQKRSRPERPQKGASRRRAAKSSRRKGVRSRGCGEAEDEGALDKLSKIKDKKINEKNATILVVSFVLLFVVFIIAMTMYGENKAEKRHSAVKPPQDDRSVDALTDMVYNDPTNRTLRLELAELLLRTGEFKKAYEHFGQLVDQDNISIFNKYVECALKLGKIDEAGIYYERAKKFAPRELETLEKLIGDYYQRNGLELPQAKEIEGWDDAMEKLKQAEEIFKANPNDNEKRKEVTRMLEECLEVFEKGKNKYPLNRLIDGRMVKANSILFMARKNTITENHPVKPAEEKKPPGELDKSL